MLILQVVLDPLFDPTSHEIAAGIVRYAQAAVDEGIDPISVDMKKKQALL